MNWLWNGKSNVVFKTKENRKKERLKKSILIFAGFTVAAVVVAVFFFLLSYDFDISNLLNSTGAEIIGEDSSYVVKDVEGEENILFYCTDDDERKVTFLACVNFDMTEKEITVLNIPVYEKLFTLNGKKASASECFEDSGANRLLIAVNSYIGADVKKYIGCREGSVEGIVANFDSIKMKFRDSVSFSRGDDVLNYESGTHTIQDDAVVKILTYKTENEALKTDLLIEMFKKFFNASSLDNRNIIYSNIVSQATTNISIIDFTSYKDYIVVLSSDSVKKTYKTSTDLNDFRVTRED